MRILRALQDFFIFQPRHTIEADEVAGQLVLDIQC